MDRMLCVPRLLRPACLGWLGLALLLSLACGDGPTGVEEIRRLQIQGRFEATIEPIREMLKEQPDDAELHLLYGVALSRSGQASLAIWSLREAQQDPTWFQPASLELARSAIFARDFPAAIEAASAVLELEPDHLVALRLRGEARLENKIEAEEGLEDLERALELDPDDLPTRLTRFRALLALERVDEAEAALAEVEGLIADGEMLDEDASLICIVGASFAYERGEVEQAEELYEGCLESYPYSAPVLDAALEFFERPDRATEILRAFSESVPQSTVHRGRLARRLRAEGKADEAEALLIEATRSESPQLRAHAWSALTDHYIAMEDLPAAVEAFESAIAYEGALPAQRRLAHADLLVAAGMNERALEVASELDDATLRDLVGARVAFNQGRPCEALELFEGAFPFWPNNAVARYYAARSAEQCDEFDKAIEHYRQSLRSGAQSSDAGLRLARMLVAEGRMQDALFGIQQHLNGHRFHPETLLLKTRVGLELQEGALLQNILGSLPPSRLRARVMVVLAEHAAAEQGAEVAIQGLREGTLLDLRRPRDAPALGLLVDLLAGEGRLEEARAAVEAALAAHPEAVDLRLVEARLLEREGAAAASVHAVLERAVELDPGSADALLALARSARARGEAERALALFDRAAEADPSDPAPAREAAQLLASGERRGEAERRLETLLVEFPQDASTALALAELELAQGAAPKALALARRALRFGGGQDAQRLLERAQAASS
jgi:tetratricopeptide (TPR) repeat protein